MLIVGYTDKTIATRINIFCLFEYKFVNATTLSLSQQLRIDRIAVCRNGEPCTESTVLTTSFPLILPPSFRILEKLADM